MDGGDPEINGRGWEMVATGPTAGAASYDGDDGDDFSVFPPCLHEGLSPAPTLDPPPSRPSSRSSGSIEWFEEFESKPEDGEAVARPAGRKWISESARRLVGSGIEIARSKLAALVEGGRGGCDGGAVWPLAAAVGLAGVMMYMRRRHRREKELLLFMILEKDERINQLMDQIVKMSEAITANYKVPVTRT